MPALRRRWRPSAGGAAGGRRRGRRRPVRRAAAARALADLQRVHQRVEALAEQLVDLGDHAAELGAVEMALHQVDHVLDQQVALHLHDGRRLGADEQHHEVVARLVLGVASSSSSKSVS